MLRYRSRVNFLVGVVCIVILWGAPVRAQEAEGQQNSPEEKVEKVQTAPEGDPQAAITTKEPDIPIEELQILVKPFSVTELQNEAAGWQVLLKNKAKEISDAEIAIKRQNRFIAKQKEAAGNLTEAKKALEEAENIQKTAAPGSPEYETATKKVEEAKEQLKKAQEGVKEAAETKADIKNDESLRSNLKEAEESGELERAKQLVEELKKIREKQDSATPDYEQSTQKIDKLEAAMKGLEEAQEERKAADSNSPEYEKSKQKLEQASGELKKVREAIAGTGKTEESAREQSDKQLNETAAALKNTTIQGSQEANGTASPNTASNPANLAGKQEQLEKAADELQKNAEAEADLKNKLVANVTELQSAQTAIADRFNVILNELERKGGDPGYYRNYIKAVSLVEVDVKDTEGLGVRLLSWFKSKEGGLRWAGNIGNFLGILIGATLASQILGWVVSKLLKLSGASKVLREFVSFLITRGGIILGLLIALTALEVSLGPLLALVGGVSFVLAFALQSNLGNFASGLTIMIYRPFDVGDEIEVAGVVGTVVGISLASTKIKTSLSDLVIIPNNTVWSDKIVNYTHAKVRKLKIEIRIDNKRNLAKTRNLLEEAARAYPSVLEIPTPPMTTVENLENSVAIHLFVWTPIEDYWKTRSELFVIIQERLEQEGISEGTSIEQGISEETLIEQGISEGTLIEQS